MDPKFSGPGSRKKWLDWTLYFHPSNFSNITDLNNLLQWSHHLSRKPHKLEVPAEDHFSFFTMYVSNVHTLRYKAIFSIDFNQMPIFILTVYALNQKNILFINTLGFSTLFPLYLIISFLWNSWNGFVRFFFTYWKWHKRLRSVSKNEQNFLFLLHTTKLFSRRNFVKIDNFCSSIYSEGKI